MPEWLLPAITTAVGALSAARRPKRYDAKAARRISDRYMGMRPGGYLTPEDEAFTERTRARGVASARRTGALGREAAQLQSRARGLSGASAGALQIEANNAEAFGRESAYGAATDAAYGLYGTNRDFEREKMFKAWGGELGAAEQEGRMGAQREAGLWNSILGTAPLIANMWSGASSAGPSQSYLGGYAEGAGGYYNPTVVRR